MPVAQWGVMKGWWCRVGEKEMGPQHRCGRLSHIQKLQRWCFPLLEEKPASS